MLRLALSVLALAGCGPSPSAELQPEGVVDGGVLVVDAGAPRPDDAFADRVVHFMPGAGAGFGQASFPDVVLGPPRGGGALQGSLDVLALGKNGSITLEFTELVVTDGPGVDFIVFENGFLGFLELGFVEVSDDGANWSVFRCAALTDGGSEGCAGTQPVYSHPDNGISPTDPTDAGGDGFDLAQLGVRTARFVRVTDTGTNRFYAAPGGGFDLDAIAVVNAVRVDGGTP